MREAISTVGREPARQQAAQFPDDVRDPVGRHRRGRADRHRRGLPARQPDGARGAGQEHRHRLGRTHHPAGRRRARRPSDLPHPRRRPGHRRRVAAGGGGQPRDQPQRVADQEPVQRRRPRRARHRAAVPGHPHHRRRARPRLRLARRGAGAPRRHHRRRRLGAAVRQPRGSRRDRPHQRLPLHRRRQDPEEGTGQQLQRARQRQGVRALRGDGPRLSAHRRATRRRSPRSSSPRARTSSPGSKGC